jgi:hypothetical protein
MGKKTATADPRRSRGQKGSCDDVENEFVSKRDVIENTVLSTRKAFFC